MDGWIVCEGGREKEHMNWTSCCAKECERERVMEEKREEMENLVNHQVHFAPRIKSTRSSPAFHPLLAK